ncbi:MAG: hypothetical protein RhofKO_12840 [Rhodothermales bacterium]
MRCLPLLLLLLAPNASLWAQTTPPTALDRMRQGVQVSGTAGLSSEAYATTGNGRRPPLSGRAFTNVAVNAFGIRTGLNLLYSTEENRLQQSLNQLGFGLQWRWVEATVGDAYPTFSRFSLSGARVRGGVVELSPGILRIGVATGQNQSAFDPSVDPVSPEAQLGQGVARFERWITAVRVGLGDVQRTHFHLVGLSARDDTLSIGGRDPNVLPAENLSLTALTGLSLFKRRFSISGEGTISAFNRDLFAEKIDTDELLDPDSTALPAQALPIARFVLQQFTPTTSSSVSYAVRGQSRLRLKWLTLSGQYTRVGPGFSSLGLYTVRNDYAEWRVQPAVRMLGGRFTVSGDVSDWQNNLSAQRRTTQVRQRQGLNVRYQPATWLALTARVQQGETTTRTLGQTTAPRQHVTQNLTFSPVITLRRGTRIHSISLNTSLQRFANRGAENGPSLDYDTINGGLTWFGNLTNRLDANVATNLLLNSTANGDNTVLGFNGGLTQSWRERTLSLGFTTGTTRSVQSSSLTGSTTTLTQLNTTLNGQWRLTRTDQLRLSVSGAVNTSDQPGFTAFREVRAQLSYRRRF